MEVRDPGEAVVGVGRVSDRVATIRYVGGSRFAIDIEGIGGPPPMVELSKIRQWSDEGRVRITNEPLFEAIVRDIDPVSGETPTAHADGSPKSTIERLHSELGEEEARAARESRDARPTVPPSGDAAKKGTAAAAAGAATADVSGHAGDGGTDAHDASPRPAGGPVSGVGTAPGSMGTITSPRPGEDGTGRRRVAGRLVAYVAAMSVLSLVTLGVTHGLAASLAGGGVGRAVKSAVDGIQGQQQPEGDGPTVVSAGEGTIIRGDYDPDAAVSGMPVASDAQRDVAARMMSIIREDFARADGDAFTQAVNLDAVAGQVADAYAAVLGRSRPMTAGDAARLREYYKAALVQDELEHVAARDIYGSMFGGRIRDVRVDPADPNRLYVVTESLGGDHQRICLVMQGSPDGRSWSVTGINDAEGYAEQFMRGDTSKYARDASS